MFPNTNLPLNIFEERYIDMVDYSLSTKIGMIQYKSNNELYSVGCYGKSLRLMKCQTKDILLTLKEKIVLKSSESKF